MTDASVLEGRIVTGDGIVRGRIRFGETILAIEHDGTVAEESLILPGFVDAHVHGGGGGEAMEGEAGVRRMAAFHARHGTTTLLPTTVTAPPEDIEAAFAGVAAVMRAPGPDEARVPGVHLEGPFINPGVLGAQPPFAIPPDLDLCRRLQAIAPILVATVAPEIDEAGELAAWLMAAGARVQIGHTACSCEQARAALEAGWGGFTHLFNAMSGLHHRKPGAVGCALAHGKAAELILDFQHVHEDAARAALRAIPDLYCITDAVAATGMPDGAYRLGSHEVFKQGPAVRLADGALAGSVLTMDQAFRNLLRLGLEPPEAARRCAAIPAGLLGLDDRGRLAPGLRADIVRLDEKMACREVWIGGRRVQGAA